MDGTLEHSPVTGNQCLLVPMIDQGFVTVLPRQEGSPYWALATRALATDGPVTVVVPLGRRHLLGTSNETRFTRDGAQFFAETVSYTIVPDPGGLRAPSGDGYGPFSMRVVFVNDPAVGHWTLSSETAEDGQTQFDPDSEIAAAIKQFAPTGCDPNTVAEKIRAARSQAFNQIEAALKASGQIERGPGGDVLVSTASHHAFYLGYANGEKLAGVPMGNWVAAASALCQTVPVKGFSNWRLPTPEEFQTATTQGVTRPDWRLFLDTPDRRLWASLPQGDRSDAFVLNVPDPVYNLRVMLYSGDGEMVSMAIDPSSNRHPDVLCVGDVPTVALNLQSLAAGQSPKLATAIHHVPAR
jgi:hypothetical protein